MAAIDTPGAHALTESVSGWGAEFTGTAVIAIAGLDVIGLNDPFGLLAHSSAFLICWAW